MKRMRENRSNVSILFAGYLLIVYIYYINKSNALLMILLNKCNIVTVQELM